MPAILYILVRNLSLHGVAGSCGVYTLIPCLMSKENINIIEYLVCCVGAFAQRFALTNRQAYQYLHRYQGLQFLMDYYDVEHTQSIDDAVEDCATICQRHGGALSL